LILEKKWILKVIISYILEEFSQVLYGILFEMESTSQSSACNLSARKVCCKAQARLGSPGGGGE